MSLLPKVLSEYGTPRELGWGRFSDEKLVPNGVNVRSHELRNLMSKAITTHHAKRIGDSWHCEAYEEAACKEFCKPDECRRGGEHWRCCSGCFREIMARRAPELHVTD